MCAVEYNLHILDSFYEYWHLPVVKTLDLHRLGKSIGRSSSQIIAESGMKSFLLITVYPVIGLLYIV